ncbi:MAG: DUF4129 domain-containing protein [Thermoplasmata archaeon]
MSRLSRGRFNWAVPLLLFLAVLLAAGLAFNLANLDTGGEAVPAVPNAGGTSTSNAGLLDPQTTQFLFGVLFVAGLAAGTIVLLLRRRSKIIGQPKSLSFWDLLGSVIGMVLFLVLLFLWPHIARAMAVRPTTPAQNATESGAMTALPTVSGLPAGLFLAAAFGLSLVVLVWFLHLGSVLRSPLPPEPPRGPRKAAAEAVTATIQEIEFGGDVRAAILACFERFCRLLGDRGIKEQAPLTPRELESLAVRGLQVSEDSADALTSLFEEARYSRHPLGEADRDRAVESLQRIRSSLEA